MWFEWKIESTQYLFQMEYLLNVQKENIWTLKVNISHDKQDYTYISFVQVLSTFSSNLYLMPLFSRENRRKAKSHMKELSRSRLSILLKDILQCTIVLDCWNRYRGHHSWRTYIYTYAMRGRSPSRENDEHVLIESYFNDETKFITSIL